MLKLKYFVWTTFFIIFININNIKCKKESEDVNKNSPIEGMIIKLILQQKKVFILVLIQKVKTPTTQKFNLWIIRDMK